MKTMLLASALLLASLEALARPESPRTITLEDRIAAQRAVEEVYWRHRIWPKENSESKPGLDVIVPASVVKDKVEDTLAKSVALEAIWQRAMTHEQLQAELDRMVRDTRDPALLRELFAALGNDPVMIAEMLARSALADRLVRQWYARDGRFHEAVRQGAEQALAIASSAAALERLGLHGVTRTWDRESRDDSGEDKLDPASWAKLELEIEGLADGSLSPIREDDDRYFVTAILGRETDRISTETFTWMKAPFDEWWSTIKPSLRAESSAPSQPFTINALTTTFCTPGTWLPMVATVPDPRSWHSMVWTGTEMIVWGGSSTDAFQTGGRYVPATDSWTATSLGPGTPTARHGHQAVWTGTHMIVWGGSPYNRIGDKTGARYDPISDTWTPMATLNAPSARAGHTMVWTGSAVLVWGGLLEGTASSSTNSGGRYDPTTDTWTPTFSGTGTPAGRYSHTGVWTGSKLIVWGGTNCCSPLATGGVYDPSTNTWSPTSTGVGAPTARQQHEAVWTGSEMIVWSGKSGTTYFVDGGRYDPSTNTWSSMAASTGVVVGRYGSTAVWTGSELIVWGGWKTGQGVLRSGGRYRPETDTWVAVDEGSSAPAARQHHTAVWTGSEMIVWGGDDGGEETATGGRYDPTTDSWVPTGMGTAPLARLKHTAVWTGTEMIVWGGSSSDAQYASGGRYVPALDAWTPTSMGPGVPPALWQATVVWTGREMIVWGGKVVGGAYSNAGGMYDPATDSWTATPTTTPAPVPRYFHTAVWSGREMIVWGGEIGTNNLARTGGRFDPRTRTWRATRADATAPHYRKFHTAVMAGGRMVVWGGWGGNPEYDLDSGGRYDALTDTWTPTARAGDIPSRLALHAAVSTGPGMIVWGGESVSSAPTNLGWRYDATADTWAPTYRSVSEPEGRQEHVAVWTGSSMLVWGGRISSVSNVATGWSYEPMADHWMPIPATEYLFPRRFPSAVWTGSQMIVWGGQPYSATGALYCACPNGSYFYRDADGDGFGDAGVSMASCDGTTPAGYVTDASDCNDGVANEMQSDFDHDGEGDACDIDDGEIFQWRADKTSLSWQAETGATEWNVYTGDLAVLRSTGKYTQAPGSNALASRQCHLVSRDKPDVDDPIPGSGSFTLVTGIVGGIEGSLGNGTGGIRVNGNPCP